MKFRGTKLSRRTLALFAAAAILLGGGGLTGTRAALNAVSQNYDATIQTNTLGVELTEQVDGAKMVTLENNGTFTLTNDETFAIGKPYKDSIGVSNSGTADEYVRVIVRKYWTDPEGNKTTALDPSYIELNAASGWNEVKGGNDEYSVYYLSSPLAVGDSEELFTGFRVSEKVKTDGKKIMLNGKEYASDSEAAAAAGDGDVITYTYEYDGYTFNVEAEAQSVQTHHYRDAMKSVWGVNASDVL